VVHQVRHFGTSGEISKLIDQVNEWLKAGEGKIEIIAISESQGGRIGDEADPFYFSMNIVYRPREEAAATAA
jgi:hypothetical protein